MEMDDILVSFDVVSLFTKIPRGRAISILRKKFGEDTANLAEICLMTAYFKWKGEYYEQTEGAPIGSSISPAVASIYKEDFETSALEKAPFKPSMWLRSRFQPRSSSGGRDRDRGGRRAPADRRIYISNIPYEFRWQELKDLFRTEVGEVAYVELFSDDGEKPRGCGIVEFENAESVKKAVEKMHRWELKGRKLVVKEDFDIERDKYGRPMKGGSSGGGGGRGNAGMSGGSSRPRDEPRSSWQAPAPLPGPIGPTSPAIQNKCGNTYGLSPQFLECLGINGPLVSRLFVANLDYKVDEKKLRDVFRLAGKVTNAKLNRDKDGKSRGHGVVKFEHPVEAVQAISMLHNQLLYDWKMTVRMDRENEKTEGLPSNLPEGLRGIGMGLGAGGNPLLDVSRAAVLPSVVSPSLGLNSTGRFADSPPLTRRSALGYSSGAAALPGGLSVGVGSLGALAGGGDIGSIGGSLGCSLGAGLAGISS
ncbi:heterogeneous nuclear ribonucleoprotein M-like [Ischnura elegans]|uniref:heterogeneous nuclear ribonucleoprotein M-like n=1 Tax=Ischnura elegans TaxID=197161 RepID=UPI001ED8ABBC|nr:heterogeneous nuclear ribonucleoprotein M-like [Ischnura elegans]